MAITVLCTSCGINEVPAPESIEVDPICPKCLDDLINALPPITPDSMDIPCWPGEEGVTFFATYRSTKNECPGSYNLEPGEDCGNPPMEGSDLCGDCHMARCDIESPRIPR